MSVIGMRMNHLKSLMEIRNGPGAAILPPNVTKLHLQFAHRLKGGHMGPRKFWKENLPRLKYHNPAVPMIVNRLREDGPATLSIYMRHDGPEPLLLGVPTAEPAGEGEAGRAGGEAAPAVQPPKQALATVDPWAHISSSSDGTAQAPSPARGERVVTIDVRLTHSSDILRKLVQATGARELTPTEEDQAEMERLARLADQAEVDRALQKDFRDKIKAEKLMLERARKEADALKAE